MRTKTLLLAAACGLVGSLAANAQSVYSVNAVGYVNTTFAAGEWKMITNPLNSSTNSLASLFSNLQDADAGCYIYAWNPTSSSYDAYTYLGTAIGWMDANSGNDANAITLPPGKGMWFYSQNAMTVTFVGEVMQGTLHNSVAQGWTQVGSMVPQSGSLVQFGLTGASGDNVYKYTGNAGNPWATWTYIDGIGWMNADSGNLEDPTIDVGQSVWYNSSAAFTWTRTFNINQ